MKDLPRLIRQNRKAILAVFSILYLPLLNNLSSSWLEKIFGETPAEIFQLMVLLTVPLAAGYLVIYAAIRSEKKEISTGMEAPPRHTGLILLVGPGRPDVDPLQGSALPAIEYHRPEKIWLLASPQGAPVADQIRKRCASGSCQVEIRLIDSPWDVHDTYREVKKIFESEPEAEGGAPGQIIADFTGGTHPMAAGMVLACRDRWPMQYMSKDRQPVWVQFKPG